ncbi:sigma-54-dependent Fis family transcriptional regulator [Crocinitomicaceae bacterium CZZ-1]|uniref:Sigma-54-dependent Fis family transcriptional regulator n=1 Tax=Taishania pollutisoli TaxID=2766479 RepID=A0A8J6TTW0_9FLAO|nr:sigma-54 dependent transcriptional regulator [Taishania pollutisoli]MBC9813762.1 sigma-54-dependent Fis family transcriptional regulator [Taishania pollutisoli]MBX2950726.1 sigma-54-dependent Fis family transcriptional regulator [Crocinitomicaceae bacterium]
MKHEQAFNIYVVEDNEWYNKLLVHTLSLNPEFTVKSFFSGEEMLRELSDMVDVVTLDYRLPDTTGDILLKKIKERSPNTEVIIISEQSEITTAVELLKLGAYDYLVKSEDIRDRLWNSVNHVRKHAGLKQKIELLQSEVEKKYDFQNSILGQSTAVKAVHNMVSKAVKTTITVCITGETGTGKEVVAKAIHYNSERKNKPFVAINMAALPAELIESELFGYEKGAFTGAQNRRIGKFEQAHGGTLFLDEIGEMDIAFQAKLLRAIQEREITRIGGNEQVKIDCRIIVATNRDLIHEVKEGNFREDLYYRLFGLPIHLPPLRERDKDVLLLAKHFISEFCKENKLPAKQIRDDARGKLMAYNWPGNIRELKSVVELSVVMSDTEEITAEDLTINPKDMLPELLLHDLTMREYEIAIVKHYMKRFDNNTKSVADKLAIGQTTVYRLLKEDEADVN